MRAFGLLGIVVGALACGASGAESPDGSFVRDGSLPEDVSATDTSLPIDDVARVLALTANCANRLGGDYKAKIEASWPANIPICGLKGAVFWNADMDIDCDGLETKTCNLVTDPAFQSQTSATDSMGKFLDASIVPYVVIPLPSTRWDSNKAGIELGQVVLVIYQGKMAFGVFADEGPPSIIGEASVAMAKLLGVDPDPKTGGVDKGVTYVVFTGASGVVTKNEDHAEANKIGAARVAELLKNN